MSEPLDTLEIEISSSSANAVKNVNALTDALNRLKKAALLEGIEDAAEKISSIGADKQRVSVTVEQSSIHSIDNLISRIGVLQRAIEQVNATPINVQNIPSASFRERPSKHATGNQTKKSEIVIGAEQTEGASRAVEKVSSRVAALRRSIAGIGEGITRYMNSPLVAGASLWTAIGSKAMSAFSSIKKIAAETSSKIRNAFQGAANTIKNSLAPAIEYVRDKLNKLGASAQNALAKIKESKAAQAAFRTLSQPIALLAGTLRTFLPGVIGLASKAIGTLASLFVKVGKIALNVVSSLLGAFKRLASTIAGAVVGAVKKFASLVRSAAVSVTKMLGSGLAKGLKLVGTGLKSVGASLVNTIGSGFTKSLKLVETGLKTVGSSVLNYVTKPFQRAISFVQNWKKKLLSVAFYRAVRTALKLVTDGFKEGIENLYLFSQQAGTRFAPAMDSLAASGLYLKNSLGALAAPLVQAVAPAVEKLVKLFVDLLNVVNAAFAAMTGQSSYTKALYKAASWGDDLSDSMGGAAASAKEFKRYLIGIDELNVIPEQSEPGGGGGGGGSGLDYENYFEVAEVPSDLADLAEKIKAAIKAGDWYGAGELLATKLNSIIDSFDAASWGTKIGTKVQNGLDAVSGFFDNFSFSSLGAKVATLLSNALNVINPTDLGGVMVAGIKGAFDFLDTFMSTYTGPNIGKYIADIVNGWFGKMNEPLLDENGEEILDENGEVVTGWKKAGKVINDGIRGVINGVKDFIDGLDSSTIQKSLTDFFGEIEWGEIIGDVKVLVDDISGKTEGVGEVLGNSLAAVLSDIDPKDIGGALGGVFTAGINLLTGTVKGYVRPAADVWALYGATHAAANGAAAGAGSADYSFCSTSRCESARVRVPSCGIRGGSNGGPD